MKVGLLHSLTGNSASREAPLAEAFHLALEEINAQGGVLGEAVEVVQEDGGSDPGHFAERAQALLEGGTLTLFGGATSAGRKALLPILERHDGMLWYPLPYEGLEAAPRLIYCGGCLNQRILPALDWCFQQGWRRFHLIGSDGVFARTAHLLMRSEIARRGGRVVGEEFHPPQNDCFADATAGLARNRPDAVLNSLDDSGNGAFYQALRQAGMTAADCPVLAFDFGETDAEPASQGHFACRGYFPSLTSPANLRFVAAFRRRCGEDCVVSEPVATAYSQAWLWKAAVERAQSAEIGAVLAALPGTSAVTPLGEPSIQANHHLLHTALIGRAAGNGRFDIVWRAAEPQAPLPWLGAEQLPEPCVAWVKAALATIPAAFFSAGERPKEADDRSHLDSRIRLADQFFECSREALAVTDPFGAVKEVNQAFVTATGLSRRDIVGGDLRPLLAPPYPRRRLGRIWNTLRRTGHWKGELPIRRRDGSILPAWVTISALHDQRGQVTGYALLGTDISLLKREQEMLEHAAHFDTLTDLPNRMLLAERLRAGLASRRRSQDTLAVCYLDLDDFKPVNDRLGHQAGDRLLKAIAVRLVEATRSGDTVARVGGNEFVLLLGGVHSPAERDALLERILKLVAQPCQIGREWVAVSASIGVALFPGDCDDADQLLRRADQAMYRAKADGGNCIRVHPCGQVGRQRFKLDLRRKMARALAAAEFLLYYQPLVDCRAGRVVGVEALIRWQHPILGLRRPCEFLPLIENDDLMAAVGQWVLGSALDQAEAWQRAGFDFRVHVNVSAFELLQGRFLEQLRDQFKRHGPNLPEKLEIEMAETAALGDLRAVAEVIQECRKLGVRFALDDFGSGATSLLHLKRLTASTLKIDPSFIHHLPQDPGDLAIVYGIVSLANAFDLDVVAEGVETGEQVSRLLELGCHIMQGRIFVEPMPAAALAGWVSAFRPDPQWQSGGGGFPSRLEFEMLLLETIHRHWGNLTGGASQPDPDDGVASANLEGCRFSQWCRDRGNLLLGTDPAYLDLVQRHRNLHQLAQNTGAPPPLRQSVQDANLQFIAALRELRLRLGSSRPDAAALPEWNPDLRRNDSCLRSRL